MNIATIPDKEFYRPFATHGLFNPFFGYGEFAGFASAAAGKTLISADRLYLLYSVARQTMSIRGDVWECGVYKGGSAAMLARILAAYPTVPRKRLCLFDTFAGMPETDASKDFHRAGNFSDTSVEGVAATVGHPDIVSFFPGFIPDTFKGLETSRIAFAHVDVDIYQSIIDCCDFIFPRLVPGGIMVFDDYGFPSCPGAREAVDKYFKGANVFPIVLPTGQALVFNPF